MYNWPLNDPHFILLVLACLAVVTIGSIVTALTKVRRLHYEVKRHSEKINALEMAEQRRFLMELKKSKSDLKLVDPQRSPGAVA